MPFLTINIANRGTVYNDGRDPSHPSDFGHMWYLLDDGIGNVNHEGKPNSFGFGPVDGKPLADGKIFDDDDTSYKGDRYFTVTVEITQDQYDRMLAYGYDPSTGNYRWGTDIPADFDASTYRGVVNSCIDFTWKALEVGGFNPSAFEGYVLPAWNDGSVLQALSGHLVGVDNSVGTDYGSWTEATPGFQLPNANLAQLVTTNRTVLGDLTTTTYTRMDAQGNVVGTTAVVSNANDGSISVTNSKDDTVISRTEYSINNTDGSWSSIQYDAANIIRAIDNVNADGSWNGKNFDAAGFISFETNVQANGSYTDSNYTNGVLTRQEGVNVSDNTDFERLFNNGVLERETLRTFDAVGINTGETVTTYDANGVKTGETLYTYNSDGSWDSKTFDAAGVITFAESVAADGSYTGSSYTNGVLTKQEGIDSNNFEFVKNYTDGVITLEERTKYDSNGDTALSISINYTDGLPVERIAYDAKNGLTSITDISYDDNNIKTGETTCSYNSDAQLVGETITNAYGIPIKDTNFSTAPDGTVTAIIKERNIDGSASSSTQIITKPDGSQQTAIYNADGKIDREMVTDPNGFTVSDTLYEHSWDGSAKGTKILFDENGAQKGEPVTVNIPSPITVNLNRAADFLSLVSAIKSGQPLPMVSSGLKVMQDLGNMAGNKIAAQQLAGPLAIAGAVTSVMSLNQYIKQGDVLGISYSGAQLVGYTAQAFASLTEGAVSQIATTIADNTLNNVVPYLGIAMSLANGDYLGAGVAAVALALPWVGAAYAVYTLAKGLLADTPEEWGSGSFILNADGSIGLNIAGEAGGNNRVALQLDSVKQYMEYLIQQERAANPGMPLSFIPGRMPTLSYNDSHFTLHDLDPVTGEMRDRSYTYDGRRNDVAVDNPEYFQDLREATIYNALDRQALASEYEADTVKLKLDAGDPKANLTEVQTAFSENMLAPVASGDSQRFRPIALDLGGDGRISQISRNDSGIAFDVDDSGFLKQTGWLGGDDGFLVLDRNLNSEIDSGSELFSNSKLADEIKGVPELRYWDANYDGRLNADDPVFQYLQVWQDANQNGVVDANESHTLAGSGITSLNYSMNTFTRNGQDRLMASADLTADTSGTRVSVVEDGLRVETTDHEVTIICTTVRDLSTKMPNADAITATEDQVKLISPETLLANDNLLNGTRIVAVGEARNGSVRMLDSGMIEFTPEANYNGNDAGFSYTVQLASGPKSSAPVSISVSSVNDLPVATVLPDATPAGSFNPNTGHVDVSDVDTPAGPFAFEIAGNPRYGNAYIDAAGQYRYESLTGTEGALTVYNPVDANDPATADSFVIKVKDPDGGETIRTVNVTHYGALPVPAIVTPPDIIPPPVADQILIDEDQVRLISPEFLLANDNMPEGARIAAVGGARYGSVRMLENGMIEFTPEADYNGADAGFSYTVQLASGAQGSAAVSVVINPVNDLPVATVQADATPAGSFNPNTGHIDVYDVDTPVGPFTYEIDNMPQYGNAYIDAAGQYRYESLTGTEGALTVYNPVDGKDPATADSFVVRVKDPDGGETIKTVNVTHYGSLPAPAPFVPSLGADGISMDEDAPNYKIYAADLLNNDKLPAGARIIGFSDAKYGEVDARDLDSSGYITFKPDTNYNGNEAGFNYSVELPDGTQLTAPVFVTVRPVNDPPTSAVTDNPDTPVYGWNYSIQNGEGIDHYFQSTIAPGYGATDVQPLFGNDLVYQGISHYEGEGYVTVYEPIVVGNDQNGNPIYQTYASSGAAPVAWLDSNAGHIDVQDVDNPAGSFTFEIYNKPKYGYPNLGVDGSFRYESATGPEDSLSIYQPVGGANEPSVADPFQVKITDPDGGVTIQTVNATHYGDLPTPAGGGKKPIAVDLNNDGLSFTNVNDSNVYYDFNNDGWREQVSWLKNGDGFLAFDADGNGKIEKANELSFVSYAPGAQTDLEGLRGFDSNGDGLLTRLDERWSKLGIWVDANQNGVTDAGEFQTLDALGVESISLQSDGKFQQIDGNTIHGTSTVTFSDGHTAMAADVTIATSSRIIMHNPDGTTSTGTISPFAPSGQTFEGTADDDLMIGTNGNTILRGYAGDDFIYDDVGNDWIEGGDGNDVIYSGADNDLVDGGAGNDIIYSGSGNDLVFGNTGNDIIYAESGNDIVFAGEGDDFVTAGTGNDMVDGREGNDTIYGEQGNDALLGGIGDDKLYGGSGNDLLYGQEGDDLLDGGEGTDTMYGGTGNDIYYVENSGDQVIEEENAGTDLVRSSISYTLGANLENLTLLGSDNLNGTGNDLNNVLIGNAGNNTLTGGVGDDFLDGGTGVDLMQGGLGDDTYMVDNVGDLVVEQANEGTDTVLSSIDYTLGSNVESLTMTGAALTGRGNELDNRIVANDTGDNLFGLAGNDTLIGGTGNDTLDGGTGADLMHGGLGDDTYIVDNAGDLVTEQVNAGTDTVVSSIDYTLTANVENLTLTSAAVSGTGNELDNRIVANDNGDYLSGMAGNDTLIGGSGNDTLDGGAGADLMQGGLGDDTYVVDNSGDQLTEQVNAGTDTVLSSIDYTLTANVENLILTGAALNGTGNELNNRIVANDNGDSLYGLAGNDTLAGGIGNDTLDGGTGADLMQGGLGDDTYMVDNVGDLVEEQVNAGIDTVLSSIDYTLGANVENLTLTSAAINGTGNELDNRIVANDNGDSLSGLAGNDTLIGGAGNDTLDGGTGADLMQGGLGDDTYLVDNLGDQVTEQVNAGTDTVLSSIDYTLTKNVENLILTGAALSGTGNELDNIITANDNGDSLFGMDGNDTLIGGAGNDVLDGGTGADLMQGGQGDDIYIVDNAGDQVVEQVNSGIDTVVSGIDYTLTANVENLILTGTATQGTGNELDNRIVANDNSDNLFGLVGNDTLIGGAGNDTLDGGIGADLMSGGLGDDNYIVDNTGDLVVEQVNAGTDSVFSSIDYTLTANVENLTLTGSAVAGTGNELDNIITANDSGDFLFGMAGNDTLIGGAGNDVLDGGTGADLMLGGQCDDNYIVENTGDLVVEQVNAGIDSVFSSIDYTLTANVENLTLTGAAIIGNGNELDNIITANDNGDSLYGMAGNDTLIGGTGSDLLYGGAGDDTLDGRAGADLMQGGSGNDTYIVDNAGDLVTEQVNAGIDTVFSSIDYTLTANVENLVLTGSALLGRGNDLDNIIVANDNGDILYGMAGNDTLIGGAGNDIISAGDGNNIIKSGNGDNKIFAGRGDNVVTGGDGRDWIYIVDGVNRINANWPANGGSKLITAGAGDAGDINAFISGAGNSGGNIPGNLRGNNIINSGAGDDTVYLGKGDDIVDSGDGNDAVNAGDGNNLIHGGKGNDYLVSGQGNDLYQFGRGDGQDVIYDKGGSDILRLEDINSDQLWFRKSGHNLEISVVGSGDSVTVEDWYSNHTIERIEASDGKVLLDNQVDALVNAMAAFTPPAAGQITLSQPLHDQLQPLLAANWH